MLLIGMVMVMCVMSLAHQGTAKWDSSEYFNCLLLCKTICVSVYGRLIAGLLVFLSVSMCPLYFLFLSLFLCCCCCYASVCVSKVLFMCECICLCVCITSISQRMLKTKCWQVQYMYNGTISWALIVLDSEFRFSSYGMIFSPRTLFWCVTGPTCSQQITLHLHT